MTAPPSPGPWFEDGGRRQSFIGSDSIENLVDSQSMALGRQLLGSLPSNTFDSPIKPLYVIGDEVEQSSFAEGLKGAGRSG
jgi:hypothetical protein